MFYPYSDLRLRCAETLSEPDLRVLVNTRLLSTTWRTVRIRCCGFVNAATGSNQPFRPSRGPSVSGRGTEIRIFFYARPNNDRNLLLARARGY